MWFKKKIKQLNVLYNLTELNFIVRISRDIYCIEKMLLTLEYITNLK